MTQEDAALTNAEKIFLIHRIEYWQKERWKRMKRFHNLSIPMQHKHLFMQKDIDLMRRQKARLIELKQAVYQ